MKRDDSLKKIKTRGNPYATLDWRQIDWHHRLAPEVNGGASR